MQRKVEHLSTPIERPMVEAEIVRPSQREHHNFFAAVLRDPSPISPGRAREMKSTRTGSYSGS